MTTNIAMEGKIGDSIGKKKPTRKKTTQMPLLVVGHPAANKAKLQGQPEPMTYDYFGFSWIILLA